MTEDKVEGEPSKFEELNDQLIDIAAKNDMEHDEIMKLFQATCCDFGSL